MTSFWFFIVFKRLFIIDFFKNYIGLASSPTEEKAVIHIRVLGD